jgi:phosphoribosylformylglycinamidine synthase subunit PurQ / glutaminase
MKPVQALVLRAAGTNCEHETAHALNQAGAEPRVLHLKEVQAEPSILDCMNIVVFPGGFSYGDDLGAGRIQAEEVRATFLEPLEALVARGGLVLGICNGFQVLVKLGLLPGGDSKAPPPAVSLTWNDSGRYEDRWVHLAVESRKSPFLRQAPDRLHIPVAHAEGKFVGASPEALAALETRDQVALRYVDPAGRPAGFPWNPNGSTHGVAGITDPSGRVLGLMPHPERNISATHHPGPGRGTIPDPPDGLFFFRSAVETLRLEL